MKRLRLFCLLTTLLLMFSAGLSLAQRWQIVGVPIVFKAEATTMSGNETFDPADALFFVKDPGGAARSFDPSGTFLAGTAIFLINTADAAENITFDSGGIAKVVHQNECGIFVYSGSAWKVVYAGAAEIKEDDDLAIANILLKAADRYINFNTTTGSGGYGFRDASGTMQYKNSGGSWANIPSGGGGGNATYIEEGDAARVDSSAADVYLDFDDADFDIGVVGNEGNVTVNDPAIDHDATANFVAAEHVDHSGVTLAAGAGLSGGGDITSNRSFAFDGTEINSVTWGDGTQATIPFSFNLIAGDPTITAGNAQVTIDTTVGIGTSGPDRTLDVLDASNPQMRLTNTDSVHYSDFETDSNGDLTITPSGGDTFIDSNLGVNESTPATTLDVNGSAILTGSARYINFNTTTGSGGYGVRDNSGTMQFKDSTGSWTNFSVAAGDDISLTKSDASGSPQTVNLPTAVGKADDLYIVVKTDSTNNTVTIDPNASETIDGASKIILRRQYESWSGASDNANWFSLSYMGNIVNVKFFGALADGTTDDTTAVNAAISAANSRDIIYFPGSSQAYIISSTLTNSKNLTFIGDGMNTKIYMSGDYTLFDNTALGEFVFKDMWLGSAATSADTCLIKATSPASFGLMERVILAGAYYGIGLYRVLFCTLRDIGNNSTDFPESTSTSQAYIYAGRTGAGPSCNGLSIISPRLQGTEAAYGIYLTDSNGEATFSIRGGLLEAMTTAGLYISGSRQGGLIHGLHFENSGSKGMHLVSCKNISISGSYIDGPTGLHFDACKGMRIGESWIRSPQIDSDCESITLENLWYETGMAVQGSMIRGRNVRSNADAGVFGMYGQYDTDVDTVNCINTNGDLEAWTGAVPDGYTTVGTVAEETTTIRSGSSSAKLTAPASGWNCLRYALGVHKFKTHVKAISIQAWVYRPSASAGTSPRLGIFYNDWSGGWTRSFTVPADVWTPICATFYPAASGSYTSMRAIVGSYNSTENDILYVDDIVISEVQF